MGVLMNALNFAGPAVSAGASLAMGWGGAAATAAGDVASGYGQAQQYSYQATVADNNRKLQEENAQQALYAGYSSEIASKMKYGALASTQRAGIAANGIDVNVGSAKDVQESTKAIGATDAAIIHYNAAMLAFSDENSAENYDVQSKMYKAAAGGAESAGYMKAGASILSSASSLLARGAQFKLTGAAPGDN